MPNRNENTSRRIRHALKKITPTTEAKERMYAEIMRQASLREQPKKRPWYLRRQASAGICAAALVCVATVTGVLYARMPQDGKNQLEIVSPTVTAAVTDVTTETIAAAQTTAVAVVAETETQTGTATEAAATAEEATVSTTFESAADFAETETETISAGNAAQIPQTTNRIENRPAVTDAQPQTPKTTITTAAQSQQNANAASAAVTTEAAVVSDTPAAATTAAETIPIRRNIYLYYLLRRGDTIYSTEYREVPVNALSRYLGYGVTQGDQVTDTHTVIMYAISGVSEETQIAVQYAGEENYYLFTAQ